MPVRHAKRVPDPSVLAERKGKTADRQGLEAEESDLSFPFDGGTGAPAPKIIFGAKNKAAVSPRAAAGFF